MSAPSPTWYDVLGVEQNASPEQIKAAWRHATDRFEPGSGSGQFRMFNEAADVLLDPEQRAAYDATLGEPTATLAPVTLTKDVGTDHEEQPEAHADVELLDAAQDGAPEGAPAPAPSRLSRVSPLVLALLAVLTVGAVLAGVVFGVRAHQEAQVSNARDEAPAAAERAVKALFSYDYEQLPTDRKRAEGYLSPRFAKTYLRNFDALAKQKDGTAGLAVQTKAVVTTNVQGSGIVDVNDDGTVARVLVFVNLVSRKADGDPQIFQNRVAMTMEKDGARWLVSKVDSY